MSEWCNYSTCVDKAVIKIGMFDSTDSITFYYCLKHALLVTALYIEHELGKGIKVLKIEVVKNE